MIPYCILIIEDESDREFMTALYFQYQKLIYSSIRKVLSDQWLIDDAAQSSLEKLIDKVSLLRTLDRNRLINYIISTCKNTAYNLIRHNCRHETFLFDDSIDSLENSIIGLSIEDYLIQNEMLSQLSVIWDKLDYRHQYILEARYILEKSLEEIAEDLEIKPESVRMALTRARRKAYSLIMTEEKNMH